MVILVTGAAAGAGAGAGAGAVGCAGTLFGGVRDRGTGAVTWLTPKRLSVGGTGPRRISDSVGGIG